MTNHRLACTFTATAEAPEAPYFRDSPAESFNPSIAWLVPPSGPGSQSSPAWSVELDSRTPVILLRDGAFRAAVGRVCIDAPAAAGGGSPGVADISACTGSIVAFDSGGRYELWLQAPRMTVERVWRMVTAGQYPLVEASVDGWTRTSSSAMPLRLHHDAGDGDPFVIVWDLDVHPIAGLTDVHLRKVERTMA